MPLLLLIFIAVPIAEIAIFIEVGGWIGLWPTIATVVVTALVGTTLVRAQGLAAISRARAAMAADRLPVEEVLTGICLLLAGALLLTPGFLTDAIGLTLLVPPLRAHIGRAVVRYAEKHGSFQMHTAGPGGAAGPGADPRPGQGPRRGPNGKPIIEGDFVEVDGAADGAAHGTQQSDSDPNPEPDRGPSHNSGPDIAGQSGSAAADEEGGPSR